MSTNRDTTQTYNAGAYDPNTLANYQAASKNSLDSQNTAKGVFNDFMTDPWSAGGFGSILSASAGKTAMDYQPGMNALAQRASLWGTNPGFLDNSNAILAGSYGGAQQQNLANLKGQAATLQMNAANNAGSALAPKFNPLMGGKTTESYSGLGTWLPQIAAAGLGTLGGYFNKQANANTTPGGVTINGGVVPPVGSTNTTGQGGTTTGTTPNSFLDPSISNFFQQYLGISPNTAAGSANTLQGIQNALLQYGAGSKLFGSPFSAGMFGSNDPSAGGEAALANALLPLLFTSNGGSGGSGGGGNNTGITINNSNSNSNTNNNNQNQWQQQWMNANGVTGGQTSSQTGPQAPTPKPPDYNSTWDTLPNPQLPPGTPPAFGINPSPVGSSATNISFPAFDPGGTTTPQALQQSFGGGSNWKWDASQNRYDNGAGIFVDQNQQLFKEGPGGAKVTLQYDPEHHFYTDGKGGFYDSSDGHPLSSSEVSMIMQGGNGWQGGLPGGNSTLPDGSSGTNPDTPAPGMTSEPYGPPNPNAPTGLQSRATGAQQLLAQRPPTSNVNDYLNSLLAPAGQGTPVNTSGLNVTNPLLGSTLQSGYTPDIGHPAQGQPIVFQQGSSGGGTNAGFNPGTMFNAAIPWQSVTLSNGQQAVVNPLNNQSYDMSGAPLSNLWSS